MLSYNYWRQKEVVAGKAADTENFVCAYKENKGWGKLLEINFTTHYLEKLKSGI
ncbi:MAG: hypothetical protein ACQPRJ_05230 [Solitalea-like symbiont of Acarus siro]